VRRPTAIQAPVGAFADADEHGEPRVRIDHGVEEAFDLVDVAYDFGSRLDIAPA